ncbi:unnamed protein product [Prunus brigantina]
MLGGGKELSEILNYSNGFDRCVERDPTPLFTDIGFAYGFPDESRLTHPKGAEAYWEKGGEGKEREIEIDMKTQEDERAIQVEYAKEREYVRKENIEKKDRETMAMDTSHMSSKRNNFGS